MSHIKNCFVLSLILGIIASAHSIPENQVFVSGIVSDTSGSPIAEAIILISRDSSDVYKRFDTAFTRADGNFTKAISVNDNAIAIAYAVSKNGYRAKYGYGPIIGRTCNLGTIVLEKTDINTWTIDIFGRVLEAQSEKPISNALVILAVSANVIEPPETVFTDTDGRFSESIEIDSSSYSQVPPAVLYHIEMEGYLSVEGQKRISGEIVDLGEILISLKGTSITKNISPHVYVVPDKITVYSLKGQCIYSGKEMNPEWLVNQGIISTSQPIIIIYKFRNDVIFKRKVNQIQ